MALPPRAFFTLHETASRWGCSIADIAGWATEGKLDLVTGIPLAVTFMAAFVCGIGIAALNLIALWRLATGQMKPEEYVVGTDSEEFAAGAGATGTKPPDHPKDGAPR